MKLFEVHVEAVAYVWAKDEREARRIAEREIDDVMEVADFTANEHKLLDPIYADWIDSLPFGDAPDEYDYLSMGEIRDKAAAKDAEIDRDTLPLFGEGE